jgi:very-short-patch-repair endonuclease
MALPMLEFVAVVEVDGEQHVVKNTGAPSHTIAKQHIERIPGMKVLRIEKCDPNDPIGHIERVKNEIQNKFPDQEPLTPERMAEISAAAAEAHNAAAADKAGA